MANPFTSPIYKIPYGTKLCNIPIERFSGNNVTSGLLSNGGQIFFSPSLLQQNSTNEIDVDEIDRDVDRPLVGDGDYGSSENEDYDPFTPTDSSKEDAWLLAATDIRTTMRDLQRSPDSDSANRGIDSNVMTLAVAIPAVLEGIGAAFSWFAGLFTTKVVVITTTATGAAYGTHRAIQNSKRNAVSNNSGSKDDSTNSDNSNTTTGEDNGSTTADETKNNAPTEEEIQNDSVKALEQILGRPPTKKEQQNFDQKHGISEQRNKDRKRSSNSRDADNVGGGAEHTSNTTPSNRRKHQQAESRRARDQRRARERRRR